MPRHLRKQKTKTHHDTTRIGIETVVISTQAPKILRARKGVLGRLPNQIGRQVLQSVDTRCGLKGRVVYVALAVCDVCCPTLRPFMRQSCIPGKRF